MTGPLISNIGFSEHCLVTSSVNYLSICQKSTLFQLKGFSVESFKLDLSKSALCGDLSWTVLISVDPLFDRYSYKMATLLDLHAPRCRKRRKNHLLTPWFDDEFTTSKLSTGEEISENSGERNFFCKTF